MRSLSNRFTWLGVAATVLISVGPLPLRAAEMAAEPAPVVRFEATWAGGLAVSPDSRSLACGCDLHDAASGKLLRDGDRDDRSGACIGVAFSPDGRHMASVHNERVYGSAHRIQLWTVGAGGLVRRPTILRSGEEWRVWYRDSLGHAAFSPDGRMLATQMPDDTAAIWDTRTGRERVRLNTGGLALAFAPDARSLTSVTRAGLVQHWDLATGKRVDTADGSHPTDFQFAWDAVASADGNVVAITDRQSVVLKGGRIGETLRRFDHLPTTTMALSPDGKTLAVAYRGVTLLDTASGRETGRLSRREHSVDALAFSPDGLSLAVGMRGTVEVWKLADLARAERPNSLPEPAPPLEATLVSQKNAYTLDLGGKSAEEFSYQFRAGRELPAAPEVELVLSLRNTSKRTLTVGLKGSFDCHLVGFGAINHPIVEWQTGVVEETFSNTGEPSAPEILPRAPTEATLAPGERCSIPIRSLDFEYSQRSYWLRPGEYDLRLSYRSFIVPATEGKDAGSDEGEYATMRAAPLRLKVVSASK